MARARLQATALAVLAPLVLTAAAAAQDLGTDAQREQGKELYDKFCSQCHGENGDGQGYATGRVNPAPRDFTSGKYKIRTTSSGRLPTDQDLVKVIRDGLPYTSMPAWPTLSDQEVRNIIYHLKSFSPDFQNPDLQGQPITIPQPLPSTEESVTRGRQIYEELGCSACHGDQARGNGPSAPTLTDDWGHHIRVADLTKRWTFRGGPTKQDIFRTFSTGLNGTPMPSYMDSLGEEDRLHLTNYIYSLGDGDDPNYASLLIADFIEDEIDTSAGVDAALPLFEGAAMARFPLIGQIMEPGRDFYPSANSVEVKAVYNRREIAFLVRWGDMRAETGGHNSPTLEVPPWDQDNPEAAGGGGGGGEEDFFGGLEESGGGGGEEDFFGGLEEESGGDEDFFGGAEEGEDEGDFWGASGDEASGGGGTADTEFSDAVALQFPSLLPTGNRKPYFIFGDGQSRVDIWYTDLSRGVGEIFTGRGSEQIEPSDVDEVQVTTSYDNGTWSVIFKRNLRAGDGISFAQGQFTPLAFSVWDGFNRERGNKRALSSWFYVYNEPAEKVSAAGPMIRTALLVLVAELLLVFAIRRRSRDAGADAAEAGAAPLPESGAAS